MKPAARRSAWRLARVALLVGGPCALTLLPAPLLPWPGKPWAATPGSIAAAAAALLGLIAWVLLLAADRGRRADDRWARQHPLTWWALLALGSAIITASLIGESIHAQFRIIDDHRFATAPWPKGHLPAQEFFALVAASGEIGHPTLESRRYRPVDTTLLYGQRMFFGDRPADYWALRIALFGAALALAWGALWVWLGGMASGVVIAWLLTFPFWSDIWCRLGPAEGTATFGTALLAAGAAGVLLELKRFRRIRVPCSSRRAGMSMAPRRRNAICWVMIAVGGMLAMGSKENFLILLPITWLLMAWVGWHRRLGRAGWIAGALLTLWGGWIGGVVAAATLHAGKDFYANPVTAGSRLTQLIHWVQTPDGAFGTIVAVVGTLTLIPAALLREAGKRRWKGIVASTATLALAFFVTALSQVVLYNGEFSPPRYNFPFLIAGLLGMVTLVGVFLQGLRVGAGRRAADTFLAALLLVLGCTVLVRGYTTLRREAHHNVVESRQFTAAMDQIGFYARREPDRPLLFVAHRPLDAEPVESVLKFLRVRGVTNEAFLYNRGYDLARITDPLNHTLGQTMSDRSINGGDGFLPYRLLPKDQVPFGLFFSGPPTWHGPMDALYVESNAGAVGE